MVANKPRKIKQRGTNLPYVNFTTARYSIPGRIPRVTSSRCDGIFAGNARHMCPFWNNDGCIRQQLEQKIGGNVTQLKQTSNILYKILCNTILHFIPTF